MEQENFNFAVTEDGSVYLEKCTLYPSVKLSGSKGTVSCQNYAKSASLFSNKLDSGKVIWDTLKKSDGYFPHMQASDIVQEGIYEPGSDYVTPPTHPIHDLTIPCHGNQEAKGAEIMSIVFRSAHDTGTGMSSVGDYNCAMSTSYDEGGGWYYPSPLEWGMRVYLEKKMCHYAQDGSYRPFHVLRIESNSDWKGYTITIITSLQNFYYGLYQGTLLATQKKFGSLNHINWAHTFVIDGTDIEIRFDIGDSNYNFIIEAAYTL